MKEIMKQPELGDYIANLRKEQGLTQEELVERCNINVRTIQRIEAGDVTPRNYTIKNILNALGSSFEAITQKEQKTTEQETAMANILKNPGNGMLVGILGILYILVSIQLEIIEVSVAFTSNEIWSIEYYGMIAILYLILLNSFYLSLAFSIKEKTLLLKSCVLIFLLLENAATVLYFSWYERGLYRFTDFDLGEVFVYQLAYAISLIILSIPFFSLKNQLNGIYKQLGLIALIAGVAHLTFILFPIGIAGFLLFEILLIALAFKSYQNSKQMVAEVTTR